MSAEAAAGDHAKSAREGAPPTAVPSRWRSLWAAGAEAGSVGAAVSAVLVPAFTRQWQDRQKERGVKVALVSEIGDSTSDALVESIRPGKPDQLEGRGPPVTGHWPPPGRGVS